MPQDPQGLVQPQTPAVFNQQPINDPVVVEPVKEKKRFIKSKLFIGLILTLMIIPISGVSAYTTMSWYQDPQKMIADSFVNAITAKTSVYTGTFTYTDSTSKLNVIVDVKTKQASATGSLDVKFTLKYDNDEYTISSAGLVDKTGDLYFKVIGLADIVKKASPQMGLDTMMSLKTAVDKFVAKVDGTWIRISSADLKQYSDQYATSKDCLNDTIKKYKDDSVAMGQIGELYRKNPFVVVDKDLGLQGTSYGYKLTTDSTKGKAFVKSLADTEVYKSLHQCDNTYTIDTNQVDSEINNYDSDTTDTTVDTNSSFNMWIDVLSHNITKIEITNKTETVDFLAVIKPEYNQVITISAPASSISLTELNTYVQELSSAYSSSADALY